MCDSNVSVLIIESHPLMREALASAIASEPGWGVAAQVVANAETELIATAVNPDMILLALGNPGLNDLDILRALRQARPTMPIIALTANEVMDQEQAALENGASCVISKSLSRVELMQALHAWRRATRLVTTDHE